MSYITVPLYGLIFDVIRGANSYIVEYLDIGLKEIIDTYSADSLELEQTKLPKKILHGSEMNLYELYLVTDNFAYYSYYDSLLMLRTDSKEIVSDNYFAEVGFWDSIENIKNGKEIHLWGELPES